MVMKDQRYQTKRKCKYRCSMLSTDFSINCAPKLHSKDRYFNYGNTSAENKGLERNRLQ